MFFKKKKTDIQRKLPEHIAIIMDGNGRWAKKRSLPRMMGHRAGADALRKVSRFAGNMGIEYITVYAFSTENWKRSDEEVNGLMSLLLEYLKNAELAVMKLAEPRKRSPRRTIPLLPMLV